MFSLPAAAGLFILIFDVPPDPPSLSSITPAVAVPA
jgi:hypothetical protein